MSTLNSTECESSSNEGTTTELYSCSHNDDNGKICISNQSLEFHKNDAVEGKPLVNVHLQDIESIESIESDAIRITTSLGDDYVFREIKNRNAVLKLVTMAKDKISSGSISENADKSSQQEEKKCDEDVPTKDIIFFNSIKKNRKSDDLKETWIKLKANPNPKLKSDLIEDTILSCNLEHFHKMFWSTNAKNPISTYQYKVIGDTEIETSQWEPSSSNQFTLKRTIKYLHPNHAPMGPPKARTTKEQELQKYGDCGMMLHTVTKVDDVPMTDCFVIEDCIFVEPKKDSTNAVMLTAKCGIRFVKKTVWKKLLESNAKKGIKKWWAGYRDFMIDTINNE